MQAITDSRRCLERVRAMRERHWTMGPTQIDLTQRFPYPHRTLVEIAADNSVNIGEPGLYR